MPCRIAPKSKGSLVCLCAVAIIALVALSACTPDVPPASCIDPNFDCYFDHAYKVILVVRENIIIWARLKLFAEISAFVAGIVATVMIALQGDANRSWTRPIGLIATALVTGISSGLVSFHVPENVDKLIDVMATMTKTVNDFDSEVVALKGGKSQQEIDEAYKSDPQFREKVDETTTRFVAQFNKSKMDMLKLQGTAAKLATIPAPPPAPNGSAGSGK